MEESTQANWAVVVIDMTLDNVEKNLHTGIGMEARKIIPNIQSVVSYARRRARKVIYACDSFLPQDIIFRSRLRPHNLRGTGGTKVIPELQPQPGELVIEKRGFSAFFRTDLDLSLRSLGVDAVVLTGISSLVCVLATAFDAIANGFAATILSDCTAAHSPEIHKSILAVYRDTPLHPVLSVMSSEEFYAWDQGKPI